MKKMHNEKKHIAVNTQLLFCVFCFIVFVGLSISSVIANEIVIAAAFGIFSLLPIFIIVISPMYFVFDKNAVKIVYNFRQTETIPWRSVRNISLMGSWINSGGLPHYVFAYYPRPEKRPFFVNGEIPKTRKTTKLIKKYYKIDIL